MAGRSTGAKPTNDETYLLWEYTPFTTFCAVPVLPAAEYPASRAPLPVPSSTTAVSMCFIISAVRGLTTVLGWRAEFGRRAESRRIRGGISVPPLAIAE